MNDDELDDGRVAVGLREGATLFICDSLTYQRWLMCDGSMTSTNVDTSVCGVDSDSPATQVPAELLDVLSVVADPTRWRILTLLSGAELCTTHLQELLGARQNLISHHLKVLREAGLVLTEPCGRFTYYRLEPAALDVLCAAVTQLATAAHADAVRRPC